MSIDNMPQVGIGVIVRRGDTVLMHQRKNAHGNLTWSLPGGHLEYRETWEECAKREVMEESGLVISDVHFAGVTNDIFTEDDKHYITIFMAGDWIEGEPEIREPEKCVQWKWCSENDLPSPLFLPIQNFINKGYSLFK